MLSKLLGCTALSIAAFLAMFTFAPSTAHAQTNTQCQSTGAWVNGVFYDGPRMCAVDLNNNNQFILNQVSAGTPPAGVNTDVQFNNFGSFGASSALTFNSNTNTLTLPDGSTVSPTGWAVNTQMIVTNPATAFLTRGIQIEQYNTTGGGYGLEEHAYCGNPPSATPGGNFPTSSASCVGTGAVSAQLIHWYSGVNIPAADTDIVGPGAGLQIRDDYNPQTAPGVQGSGPWIKYAGFGATDLGVPQFGVTLNSAGSGCTNASAPNAWTANFNVVGGTVASPGAATTVSGQLSGGGLSASSLYAVNQGQYTTLPTNPVTISPATGTCSVNPTVTITQTGGVESIATFGLQVALGGGGFANSPTWLMQDPKLPMTFDGQVVVNTTSAALGTSVNVTNAGAANYAGSFVSPVFGVSIGTTAGGGNDLALGANGGNVIFGSNPDGPQAQFTATSSGTTLNVSAVASGALAVGQVVLGPNIPSGTTISSLGTGSGGTGTYILNQSVSIGSGQTMYGSVSPGYDIQYAMPGNTHAYVVNYNGHVGIGLAPDTSAQLGMVFQATNAATIPTRIELDPFGASGYFSCARSDGISGTATAVQSGEELCSSTAFGYNGTSIVGPLAAFRTFAAQNFSVGATGAYADIATTPNGSSTEASVLRFDQDAGIWTPSATGGDKGPGTINAQGLYVNGVAVVGGAATSVLTAAGTVGAPPVAIGGSTIGFFESSGPSMNLTLDGATTSFAFTAGTLSKNTFGSAGNINDLTASGTVGSPTAVSAGTALQVVASYGYDGASYVRSTEIETLAEGTISSGVVPSQMDFFTTTTGGTITLGADLDDAQLWHMLAGMTETGGIASINASSNFAVNIATGTSTGIVTIGNASNFGKTVLAGVSTGTNADFLCLSSGGVVLLQTSACTISSRRFKTDIQGFGDEAALNDVMRLHPVTFHMKAEMGPNRDNNYYHTQLGLIAENVADVDPRAAIYEQDDVTPKSYRQESVISALVGAVHAQQAQIADLQRRLGDAPPSK